jgi:anionic cell wall polymer biosynthesis LytR-Cps2A-Psr (LCP) family protein
MKNQFDWSKIVLGIVYLAIFAIGFFLSYEGFKMSKIFVKNPLRSPNPTPNTYSLATAKPISQVEPVKQEKGTYNILLLGYGGINHSGGLLTDSIIVTHVNIDTKKVTFISIPRDLWITGNHKINTAGISGFQSSGPVVTSVTGLPINYFIAVDFSGFVKIIDDLGGITANTPVSFEDKFYPIAGQENNTCGFTNDQIEAFKAKYSGYTLETQFTCRYEDLKFSKGPVNLDGTTALKYVRSRHGDSDFGRSARQFAVLEGIATKLISIQVAGKFDGIVGTISQIVRTDLDAGTIKSLIAILGDPKAYTFNQIQLTTDNLLNTSKSSDGQFILIPKAGNFNFTEIQNFIKSNTN